MFAAASEGDIETLKKLIDDSFQKSPFPVDINMKNLEGETILHVAVQRGDLEMIKYLVEKEVDANVCTFR